MKAKSESFKIIVVVFILAFLLGLFFSVRFLQGKFKAINAINLGENASALDLDNYQKVMSKLKPQ